MERRSLERRKKRWICRVDELSEELVVEPSEEVDRLGLGYPERPCIPGRQTGKPTGTKQRFQVDDDEQPERRADEAEACEPALAQRRSPGCEQSSDPETCEDQHGTGNDDGRE